MKPALSCLNDTRSASGLPGSSWRGPTTPGGGPFGLGCYPFGDTVRFVGWQLLHNRIVLARLGRRAGIKPLKRLVLYDDVGSDVHCADQIRRHTDTIVERATPALRSLLRPDRSVDDRDLGRLARSYIDAFAWAIELDDPAPLHGFLEALLTRWPLGGVPIEQVTRGIYEIADILRSVLVPDDDRETLDAIERLTREAVATFPNLALTALTAELRGEVERHRIGEERLLSLQRVSAAVTSDLDLDRTLTVLVEEARRLMNSGAAGIRLVDEDAQTLRLIARAGSVDSLLYGDALPIEGPLAGYCFRSGQPLISNDMLNDTRAAPGFRTTSVLRSLVMAPLKVRDRPIGVLLAGNETVGTFTEEDQRILSLFADQAAGAIENGRLYQQAQQQIAELAALQRISSVISSSLDLEAVFRAIYDEIRGIMSADAFLIGLRRPDRRYDLEFIIDDGQRYPPRRPFEFSPALRVTVDERRPVVIGDVLDRAVPKMHTVGNPQTEVRSLIAAPLLRGAEVVGLLSAQSYVPYTYRDSDARLLMTIANHAVVAIEHARLYSQAQSLAVAEERNRLAREIHDTLAQGLIGITLYLERLEMMVPPDDPQLRPLVERALALTRGNLEEARRSVHDLRAAPLEGRTLVEALGHLADDLGRDGFAARLAASSSLPMLAARVETALFRMAQEATTNSRKHAGCTMIEISLSICDDRLCLEVSDDGNGFDAEAATRKPHRFGLSTMRERIAQVGGTFAVASQPARGTRVRAEIPLARAVYAESDAGSEA